MKKIGDGSDYWLNICIKFDGSGMSAEGLNKDFGCVASGWRSQDFGGHKGG